MSLKRSIPNKQKSVKQFRSRAAKTHRKNIMIGYRGGIRL